MPQYRFEQQFFQYFEALKRNLKVTPVYLGGIASSGGGGDPGTWTGKLPQTRISYDLSELATNVTASGPSLLDNLNHIRYRLENLEDTVTSGAGGYTPGHIIYDGVTEKTQRQKLVFDGNGITVVDNAGNDSTDITINPDFLDLTDTPSSYTSESGQMLRVNAAETGIEFADAPYAFDKIIRYDSGGTAAEEYAASENGLRSALGDAVSGDVVLLPAKTIYISEDGISGGTNCLRLEAGVTLKGISRESSIISANISTASSQARYLVWMKNDSVLSDVTIYYTRDNEDDVYGIGSDQGTDVGIGGIYNTTLIVNNLDDSGSAPVTRALSVLAKYSVNDIKTIIDNCTFIAIGGQASNSVAVSYSTSTSTKVMFIRNSIFQAYDDVDAYSNGYAQAFNVYNYNHPESKVVIEDCRFYGYTDGSYSTEQNNGLFARGYFDIKNCYAISESTGTGANVRNFAFYITATNLDYPSNIVDCIGYGTNASTTTTSPIYHACGIQANNSIIQGGYFEGDNSSGDGWGIHVDNVYSPYTGSPKAYNTIFVGSSSDIRVSDALHGISVYSCQYSTTDVETGGTFTILQGDRGAYSVEDYHASDIENDILTRHLPLPTLSGFVPVADGTKWVLDSGSFGTFKSLTDTPSSYTGYAEKIVVVNDTEDGLDFVTLSGMPGSGPDQKVKISSNDSQQSYLGNKLVAGSGIIITELNDGAFETLEVAVEGSVSGNKIILYRGVGGSITEYDATESGLKSALGAATSGDTVLIPPQTITISVDGTSDWVDTINIPAGVTLQGVNREYSKLVATISNSIGTIRYLVNMGDGSILDNLTIEYTRSNATNDINTIYKSDAANEGVQLRNCNIVTDNQYSGSSTSIQTYGLNIKVTNYVDRENVAIDNCIVNTKGIWSYNYVRTNSNRYDYPLYIKNSEFTAYDPVVHTSTHSYCFGLYVYGTYSNKVIVDNCKFHAEIESGGSLTNGFTYGVSATGNADILNSKILSINPATGTTNTARGLALNNTKSQISKLTNTTIDVTTSTTSTVNTGWGYGASVDDVTVEGCHILASGLSSGYVWGILVETGENSLYNSTFEGTTKDIYMNTKDVFDIYGCKYDSIEAYVPGESPDPLKGDRASYTVVDHHADDIESGLPVRHLPLPTPSGYSLISDGNQWILSSGIGTFKQLLDTPDDYTGQANKVLVVNPGETAIAFQDGGTGDMLKTTYDTDDNGIVDVAETAPWNGITGKPSTFPPETHNHDDRYYKETEIDLKLQDHDEFLDMDDTPNSYAGHGLQAVIVTETEDELEFVDVAGISSGIYYQVLTSTNDEYPRFLSDKLITGNGITVTEVELDPVMGPWGEYTNLALQLDSNLNATYKTDLGAKVSKNGPFTVTASGLTIEFDVEHWDTDNCFSLSTPDRLTCNTEGKYLVVGNVVYAPRSTDPPDYIGNMWAKVEVSDSYDLISTHNSEFDYWDDYTLHSIPLMAVVDLSEGNYLQLKLGHTCGGTMTVPGVGGYACTLTMHLIEPMATKAFIGLLDAPFSYSGAAGKIVTVNELENAVEFSDISVAVSGVDFRTMVSSNDATTGYLSDKISAGSNIIVTEVLDGGDESLRISTTSSGIGDMLKSVYDTNDDGIVDEAATVTWSGVTGKPSTFPPETHNHDDRYYTETELDGGQLDNRYYTESEVDTALALQDEFTELTDTPSSYSGEVGKVLVVNETEDGMEFTTMSGAGTGSGASNFLELTDSPTTYSGAAGKSVVVASGENELIFSEAISDLESLYLARW